VLFNWSPRHEGVLRSGCIAPRSDLGTRWRWGVSLTPRPLYPQGKSPWYLLDRRLGGPQSRSGRGGEEKNSQPLPWLELLVIQHIAQRCATELSRLPLRSKHSLLHPVLRILTLPLRVRDQLHIHIKRGKTIVLRLLIFMFYTGGGKTMVSAQNIGKYLPNIICS
jgi:hypothetical protein